MKSVCFRLLVLAGLIGSALLSAGGFAAEPLRLEGFLEQVKKSNGGYQSAVEASEGAAARVSEGGLIFAPTLDAGGAYLDDKSQKTSPFAQGDRTRVTQYGVGLSKVWGFGLYSRLSYGLSYTRISGAATTALPNPNFWDAKPMLELSLPVWGGAFGSGFRAQAEALEASARAQASGNAYLARQLLAQAEAAYWRLALARDVLGLQRENLDRAQQIQAWNKRRVGLNLTDSSDLYQAEALLQLRKIELQQAIDEERAASAGFNLARGIDSETVAEKIESTRELIARNPVAPKRAGKRLDVEATQQEVLAAQASAKGARERNKPSLEVYSTLSLNGKDDQLSPAVSEGWKSQYSNNLVGVRLSVPLSFGSTSDVRAGYEREIQSAELRYQRKVLEEEVEWKNLEKRYLESVRRFALVQEVEAIQKRKFLHEQQRQKSGRSTNYLVLQFEQDYVASQINRLRAESEILNLLAAMKTFARD